MDRCSIFFVINVYILSNLLIGIIKDLEQIIMLNIKTGTGGMFV
ncbi:hypothetical protein EDD79_100246 [Serpentinicella alkaliphila]|uniref:Uncharacterized protein n=1 Tax=Serpentinicella alkaliphila TaxID=1734049 RepID=A0A4R2TT27_9FIRM|nr:hypothetical protein EDD79_100246 [Serpentinicella alkaliphila]